MSVFSVCEMRLILCMTLYARVFCFICFRVVVSIVTLLSSLDLLLFKCGVSNLHE